LQSIVDIALGEMERNSKKSAFIANQKSRRKTALNPVNSFINALLVGSNL